MWARVGRAKVAIAIVVAAVVLIGVGVTFGARLVSAPVRAATSAAAPSAPTAGATARHPGAPRWFRMTEAGVADRAQAPIYPNAQNYSARTTASGPLLLFLPATGEQPRDYSRFLGLATKAGYHVIGLDYWNLGDSVASTCQHDAACYGMVQRNRFDGSHPFAKSTVDPRNAIRSRLLDVLASLRQRDPDGGWGQYSGSDGVHWSDVVLAGHSQGGGESAYIAHIRAVRGVLMFGSPIVTDGATAATWLSTPSATPASRMYAFDNTSDVFWPRIQASWQRLGLGSPQVATGTPETDLDAHSLISTTKMPHAHLWILDDSTPKAADGTPVYQPVWDWMLQRFAPSRAT